MSKIILLGAGNTPFSTIATKWSYILMAFLFFSQSVLTLFRGVNGPLDGIYLGATLIGGFYALIIVILAYSKSSKYSLKIMIDDTIIEFKTNLFKSATKIKWPDINIIEFKAFRVDFQTKDGTETLIYDTSPDTSIEIKEAIRELAKKNNIEVIGG